MSRTIHARKNRRALTETQRAIVAAIYGEERPTRWLMSTALEVTARIASKTLHRTVTVEDVTQIVGSR